MDDDVAVATADEDTDVGGLLEVLDPTGHFEVRWGRKKSEVEHAEKTFDDLIKKGYLAFKKTWTGRKGKKADGFDPKAGVYVFEGPDDAKSTRRDLPMAGKGDPSYEQTKKFDKKADHVMTPPMRGG